MTTTESREIELLNAEVAGISAEVRDLRIMMAEKMPPGGTPDATAQQLRELVIQIGGSEAACRRAVWRAAAIVILALALTIFFGG